MISTRSAARKSRQHFFLPFRFALWKISIGHGRCERPIEATEPICIQQFAFLFRRGKVILSVSGTRDSKLKQFVDTGFRAVCLIRFTHNQCDQLMVDQINLHCATRNYHKYLWLLKQNKMDISSSINTGNNSINIRPIFSGYPFQGTNKFQRFIQSNIEFLLQMKPNVKLQFFEQTVWLFKMKKHLIVLANRSFLKRIYWKFCKYLR